MYGFERLQSYSLVLAPKEHPSTVEEFNSLYNELHEEYQQKIKSIDLEDFVNKIICACPEEYKSVFERFHDRYLNWDKLRNY